MKPASVLALFCFLSVACSRGQGTLTFANNGATKLTNNLGSGTSGQKIGIYWGPVGSAEDTMALLPAASNGVTQAGFPLAGFFNGGIATFPVPSQTAIWLQIRVWPSSYSDYLAAYRSLADTSGDMGRGRIQKITLGGSGTPQSLLAPTGSGDTSFNRFGVGIPSTFIKPQYPLSTKPTIKLQPFTNGSLKLSWPMPNGGVLPYQLVLQETPSLQANPIAWTNAPFANGAILPASPSNRFFRLTIPPFDP